MKVMMRVGLVIAMLGTILMPVFAVMQKYVPIWIFPLICYGSALILTSGLLMHWKKWRLSRSGAVGIKDAEAFTSRESLSVFVAALIPAFVVWGIFSLLSALRY